MMVSYRHRQKKNTVSTSGTGTASSVGLTKPIQSPTGEILPDKDYQQPVIPTTVNSDALSHLGGQRLPIPSDINPVVTKKQDDQQQLRDEWNSYHGANPGAVLPSADTLPSQPQISAYTAPTVFQIVSNQARRLGASILTGITDATVAPVNYLNNKLGLSDDKETARINEELNSGKKLDEGVFGLKKDYVDNDAGDGGVLSGTSNIVNGLAKMAPAILSSESTAGGSFLLQGIGNASLQVAKMKKEGVKFNNNSDDLFVIGSGLVNLALGKSVSSAVLKSFPAGLTNDIVGSIAANATKSLADMGTEATAKDVANTYTQAALKFAQRFKQYGMGILKTYPTIATDFAGANLLNSGVKAATNKLSGNNPMGDVTGDEIAKDVVSPVYNGDKAANGNLGQFGLNLLSSPAAGLSALHGATTAGMLFDGSPYKNPVVESLHQDSSPENIQKIKESLTGIGQAKGWTEDEINQSNSGVDMLADIVKTLPKGLPPEQLEKATNLILQRRTHQQLLEQMQGDKTGLDPALSSKADGLEDLLKNKVDQANDKIVDTVTDQPHEYFQKGDKYYKQNAYSDPEEISKSRFDLEHFENKYQPEAPEVVKEPEKVKSVQTPAKEENVSAEPKPAEMLTEPIKPDEPKITVNEVADKPIMYNGEKATIQKDGQTLVAKITGSNREYELGNAEDIGDKSIKDFGIEHVSSVVDTDEDGNIKVRGQKLINNFSDPKAAINYDNEGNVTSVNLETPEGKKRTFRGDVAEDIAYQIHLKELNKNNETKQQFEQFVEQHEPSNKAIVAGENDVSAEKGTVEDNAPVQRKPKRERSAEIVSTPETTLSSPELTFKTSKGSTYEVQPDGTTIRNKAERNDPGHEGQKGIQEKSQKTYYITPEDANRLGEIQTTNPEKRIIAERPDGTIGVRYETGDDVGKFEKRTIVKPNNAPEVGLMPLELWKDGEHSHFGNKITEINKIENNEKSKSELAITDANAKSDNTTEEIKHGKKVQGDGEKEKTTIRRQSSGEHGLTKDGKTVFAKTKEIKTDTERFQPRGTDFSQATTDKIVNNFDDNKLDPIVLYKDGDKDFVLSGHSRLEAHKVLDALPDDSPVKQKAIKSGYEPGEVKSRYFTGTEAEAKEFADRSNDLGNKNKDYESAASIRKLRESGATQKAINERLQEDFGKDAAYIKALSYLKPDGPVISALKQLGDTGDKATRSGIEKIASWIGSARGMFDELTDKHEKEMYDFLSGDKSNGITTKADFISKIGSYVNSLHFEKDKPLNLSRIKETNEGQELYNREYSELAQKVKDKQAEIEAINDRFNNPKNKAYIKKTDAGYDNTLAYAEKLKKTKNEELRVLRSQLLDLANKKGEYLSGGMNQVSLFDQVNLEPKEVKETNTLLKPDNITIEDLENAEEAGKQTIDKKETNGSTTEQPARGTAEQPSPGVNAEAVQQPKDEPANDAGKNTESESVQGGAGGKDNVNQSLSDEELARKNALRKKYFGRLNDITNIPTLLADKEFREYAGLVFKDALGDFKAFSKEMIETIGEKIKEHLPQLYRELGGKLDDEPISAKTDGATGISKADVKEEREATGKKDIQREYISRYETHAEGKRLVDSGELDPELLAKKIISDKVPVNAQQLAALEYYKTQLKNRRNELLDRIEEKQAAGDDHERDRQKLAQMEDLIDENQQATSISTNISGRTTGFAAEVMNEDYSRGGVMRRAKIANKGNELSDADKQELEKSLAKIDELERALSRKQKERSKKEEANIVEQVTRKVNFENRTAGRIKSKGERAKENESLLSELSKLAKNQRATLSSTPLPIEAVPILGKLARNYIADGLTTIASVADRILQDIQDKFDGVNKEHIIDAIKTDFNQYLAEDNRNRLDAAKARLGSKLDEMKAGTYEPPVKRKLEVDKDYLKIKADINRQQSLINKKIEQIELANKGTADKVRVAFTKWSRAAKLSGISTLSKLASTGLTTAGLKIPEEIIGGGLSKLFPRLAVKSKVEGGFNVKALAKGYTEGITQGMRDSYDILNIKSGGKSEIEALFGKGEKLPAEAIDFFGHLHSAIKAPVKRTVFEYSLEKRIGRALDMGLDPTDPVIEAKLSMEAYEDANKAIFMGKNRLSEAYEQGMGALERGGSLSKNVAALGRMLLPFVKVPTNIAFSTGRLVFGLPVGVGQLAHAYARGIENIEPEYADEILKNLKRGSLGAAAVLTGYFNPHNIGGYYQKNEKRSPEDAKAGGIKLFGEQIPVWLTEHPIFQAMQVGATFRHVIDKYKRGENKEDATAAALQATTVGLVKNIPLADQGIRLNEALETPKAFKKFTGEFMKGNIDPAFMQQIAEYTDRKNWHANQLLSDKAKIKRNATPKHGWWKTIYRHIISGIPGARETLPVKQ